MTQRQALQTLLLQECQENLNLAQGFHRLALVGYAASMGLAIGATIMVYAGKLDIATVSGASSIPVIACTRALQRGGKQLRDASNQFYQVIESLDRPLPPATVDIEAKPVP
jgi:hypothetical protein